jgi:cation diffusion facilitator CzcD-associated flavoprotein CzcO
MRNYVIIGTGPAGVAAAEAIRNQAIELETLFKRKRTLQRQAATLAMARRLLSPWHTVHIPIGVALYITAIIHMIGVIYYATIL